MDSWPSAWPRPCQIARAVVAVQLVFNVAVIATGASVLARVFGARIREHATRPPR